ncbi:hypothetical protein IV102_34200 [bacterium]|nr:hypothetical protein [bacterium]
MWITSHGEGGNIVTKKCWPGWAVPQRGWNEVQDWRASRLDFAPRV